MIHIIPEPKSMTIHRDKGSFPFSAETALVNSALPQAAVDDFQSFLKQNFHFELTKTEGATRLSLVRSEEGDPESYRMAVSEQEITVSSAGEVGLFYALQTLKQILLSGGFSIPSLVINDAPLYPYRGFMLDVGRYFYPVEEVKHFLDLMAVHKLNTFHWHLTEDQGWRVEIKKYPRLTEFGSRRTHTNFGFRPHGGFYTQEEIREVVAYAHSKYIRVIPEIDMPGHMQSAIACYPELSCFDRKLPVATHWGVKHDILCAGKESTYRFVCDVLDELIPLFPDGYFHIGGDEVVKMRWRLCPHCQALMKKMGLKDEEELQQSFMSRVNRHLKEQGFTSMMWNWDSVEATEWLDRDIVWQMCGMPKNTQSEIMAGRRMVNSVSFPYYLDLPYGWFNLQKTYENTPEIPNIDETSAKNLLGLEAPLWTEYVPNMKKADYCTYPRLGAIAEIAWTAPANRSWEHFQQKLGDYYRLLSACGVKHPATLKQAMPGTLRAKGYSLWFNRRQLHWAGLHNLIDDARVKQLAAKYNR
jgi:hexosaminidase